MGRFESAFTDWGRRPPSTPPAIAMRRLSRLLMDRPSEAARPRSLALARLMASAAVVILGVGVWLLLPTVSTPPQRAPEAIGQMVGAHPVAIAPPAPIVDDSVLVLDLDPETTLYLTLVPPRAGKGGPS